MSLRSNISTQLVGFMLAVSVIPMLAMQWSSYLAVSRSLLEVAKVHSAHLLEIQQDYIALQTDQIESMAENPGWAREIERLPPTTAGYRGIDASFASLATKNRIGQLLSGYAPMNGLESIDLLHVRGNHYHVGERPNEHHEDTAADAEQFAQASESPGKVVWLPGHQAISSPNNIGPMFAAVKAIYRSADGRGTPEMVGMLRINLSTEFLYEHFNALKFGEGAHMILVGQNGKMIFHPDKKMVGQTLPSQLAAAVTSPSGSQLLDIEHQPALLSYLYIPQQQWTLLSIVPYATLSHPMRPVVQNGVAWLVLSLLGIVWFTRLYWHRVVLPIRDVTNGFKDFQANRFKLDQRLQHPRAWFEIGLLVHWFNAFLDAMQSEQRATQELRASEEGKRALISAIPDLIFVNHRDGRFLEMHAKHENLLLHSPAVILNHTINDLLPPSVAQQFMQAIAKALESGQLEEVHYSLEIQGKPMFFEARFCASGPDRVVSIVRDTTARKILEDEQRVGAIAFESELGMVITDAGRRILRVNRSFTRITGFSDEDAVGQSPRILSSGRHDAAFYDDMNDRLAHEGSWQGEVWNRRKNGEIYPVWLSISIVRSASGEISNYVGSHHDISERKNTEFALKRLYREVEESRKSLRAMSSQRDTILERERKHVAREIHDELGQVLTALRMHLSMTIKEHGRQAPSLAQELQSMKRLVDQGISGVRNVAAHLRPTALDMGILAAIEWLGAEFSKRTSVPCTITVQPDSIALDDARAIVVFRIVQESLTNIARHAAATLVEITLDGQDDALHLLVRDNGQGFFPNARIHRKAFGLLGMRERALALGARLEITSTPGLGTVVVLKIPFDNPPGETVPE